MEKNRILITGACSPFGTALTAALRRKYGYHNVVAAGKTASADILLDLSDKDEFERMVRECGITQVYVLGGMDNPDNMFADAHRVSNIKNLVTVLEVARRYKFEKVFWASNLNTSEPVSTLAADMKDNLRAPADNPENCNLSGDCWCNYYFEKFGIDIRSILFPGIISGPDEPTSGYLSYVSDLLQHAIAGNDYTCFLAEDTCLPAIYMTDAVRAVIELMDAPKEKLSLRAAYLIAGLSFAPCDLEVRLKRRFPLLNIRYKPDVRDVIASNITSVIDNSIARIDWGWTALYSLDDIIRENLPLKSSINNVASTIHEYHPHESF